MAEYFRCGDLTRGCEWARTGKVVAARDWICPCNNAHCQQESVPWLTAMWELHRNRIIVFGAVLAVLLASPFAIWLFRPDALAKEVAKLKEKAEVLDGRLRTMEAKPSGNAPKGDPLELLRQLVARAKELEGKVRTNVDGGQIESARANLQTLEALPNQAEAALQAVRNPVPASGSRALEAQQLITELQDAEGGADALSARTRNGRRSELTAECEKVIESTRAAITRVRRLIPRQSTAPPPSNIEKSLTEVTALLVKARKTLESYVPPPEVPFQEKDATLVIVATSDLAANLILPMLKARSGGEIVPAQGQVWYYTSKSGFKPEEKVIVRVAGGSPYRELIEKRADLILSDVAPEPDELRAFEQQFPGKQLSSRSYSEVVALDALTLLAHPDSPESDLTAEQAKTTRWIGGPIESPELAVATRFGFQIAQTADKPADAVLTDRACRGLGIYHKEGANIRAKRLAYKPGAMTIALKPSPFTIATEDYKFSFRILASHSPGSRPGALDLVHFMTKSEGQAIVSQQGYVDLGLRSMSGDADPLILAILAKTLGKEVRGAVRMSTNFRFGIEKGKLDIKGLADLERLAVAVAKDFRTAKMVILGFTDSRGGPQINGPLSIARAKFVADNLEKSIPGVKYAGLADQLPVDINDGGEGSARNRRAEVWVVPD